MPMKITMWLKGLVKYLEKIHSIAGITQSNAHQYSFNLLGFSLKDFRIFRFREKDIMKEMKAMNPIRDHP